MKRFMKWTMLSLVTLCLALPLPAHAKTTLKLAHPGATNHHYHATSVKFKEAVEQRTNGELEIQIFPSDQLGSARQLLESAQLGAADMVLQGDQIAAFVDEFSILSMPFLFRDLPHLAAVMDGPIGDWFAEKAKKKGFIILGYWENGLRHITNNKRPINTPDDLKGLKIRTPNAAITIEYMRMLGAAPTPMPFGEVYSALQLGTVDGQENPIAHALNQNFYEVQKYLSLTGHAHIVETFVMSKVVFDRLTPVQQTILLEEGKRHAAISRQMVVEEEGGQLEKLRTLMTVNQAPSAEPFKQLCAPLYDKMRKRFGNEIFDKIDATK